MHRHILAPRLTRAILLAGFLLAPFSPARAQYAEFLRGANLEGSRPGNVAKASAALAGDGSIAILACVTKPDDHKPEPYLILWKLRTDGSVQWSRAWGFNQFHSTLTKMSPTLNLAIVPDGSLVMTGAFAGTIDFGGGPLTSVGYDIFLVKLDASGNHVWSRSFGAAYNDLAYRLLIADNGNITLAGKHTGVDFGGGPLDASYGPYSATRFFRATFAPDGTHLSSASFGSSEGTMGINDMAIGSAGDVYAIGGSDWRLKFGETTLEDIGSADIVMAGFDAAGNVRMAKRFGSEYFDTGYGIALTPDGDLLTTGIFSDYVSVGGSVLGSCIAFSAVYIARYAADGVHKWSHSSDPCAYGNVDHPAIALHPSGGFAITGDFTGALKFDQTSLYARAQSVLALYFDADGNLIWMGKGAAGAKGLAAVAKPGGDVVIAGSNDFDLYFCTGDIMKTPNARGFVAEFSDVPHIDTQAPPMPRPRYDGTTLSWDASIDPEGASVRYRVEELRYFNYVDRVTLISGTSMPLNALESPNDYIYVTAIDCFDHESQTSFRVEIHPSKRGPLAPENVHFEGSSLVWSNPTDADLAGVAVGGVSYWGAPDTVRLATTLTPSLNVENLSYHYYTLAAVDSSGNWSSTTMLVDQVPPSAPTGLAYAIPKLTWDGSKDVGFGAFEVYASKFADFSKEKRVIFQTGKTELEVPIEQRDSYYHVVQYDRSGNTSAPATVAGYGGARPARPRSLAYRDGHLSWKTEDTDIDHYDIFASTTDASAGPRVLLGSTGELEFDVTGEAHDWYYVVAIDDAGQESVAAVVSAITGRAPSFTLSIGVLANPFRDATTIQYSLPKEGRVKIALYDVRGAHVVTLVNGMQSGGSHYVDWSGGSESRGDAPSGVYFARLQFGRHERVAKLILLR